MSFRECIRVEESEQNDLKPIRNHEMKKDLNKCPVSKAFSNKCSKVLTRKMSQKCEFFVLKSI